MHLYCLNDIPEHLREFFAPAPQMGLEKTPEQFVAGMVAVFREVRRVLRSDGTLWLNMGDSYAAGGNGIGSGKQLTNVGSWMPPKKAPAGLKPKDLLGIPWLLAFALRANGWYLRQRMPWLKRNPMPESCSDRPSSAIEEVFLFSKSARYYYDAEAVRIELKDCSVKRLKQETFDQQTGGPKDYGHRTNANRSARKALCNLKEKLVASEKWGDRHDGWENRDPEIGRNRRNSDWFWDSWQGLYSDEDGNPLAFVVNPQGFKEAHFATFPAKLVEPCILAGTSAHGCCHGCGAPWVRHTTKERKPTREPKASKLNGSHSVRHRAHHDPLEVGNRDPQRHVTETVTTGWAPSCKCREFGSELPVDICTVLDPFSGAGTTVMVARRLGRRGIGIELNPTYAKMSERRIRDDAPLTNQLGG